MNYGKKPFASNIINNLLVKFLPFPSPKSAKHPKIAPKPLANTVSPLFEAKKVCFQAPFLASSLDGAAQHEFQTSL